MENQNTLVSQSRWIIFSSVIQAFRFVPFRTYYLNIVIHTDIRTQQHSLQTQKCYQMSYRVQIDITFLKGYNVYIIIYKYLNYTPVNIQGFSDIFSEVYFIPAWYT